MKVEIDYLLTTGCSSKSFEPRSENIIEAAIKIIYIN